MSAALIELALGNTFNLNPNESWLVFRGDRPALILTPNCWPRRCRRGEPAYRRTCANSSHAPVISEGIDVARRKRLAPLAEVCAPLSADPSVGGFISAFMQAVVSRDELGWKPVRRDATMLMSVLSPDSEDPILALGAMPRRTALAAAPCRR